MKGRKIITLCCSTVLLVFIAVMAGSMYMLDFSLKAVPQEERLYSIAHADSMAEAFRDTFVVMPSGERHHAIFMRNDSARGRTAIVVHGYKDNCMKFSPIAMMYYRSMGYNILLPDLHGHGKSEGEDIRMGWHDRWDVLHWTKVAESIFRDSTETSRMVLHGVSMGAATVMCLSGESDLPEYIRCFVEDCGYSSVWEEFSMQLKEQFSLPPFPLMYTTDMLCRMRYGWGFREASPLDMVERCRRPMLFIHGDADTFVPFAMLQPLYDAKPEPKMKWIAEGSEHACAYKDHPEEYAAEVKTFLERYME